MVGKDRPRSSFVELCFGESASLMLLDRYGFTNGALFFDSRVALGRKFCGCRSVEVTIASVTEWELRLYGEKGNLMSEVKPACAVRVDRLQGSRTLNFGDRQLRLVRPKGSVEPAAVQSLSASSGQWHRKTE